MSTTRITTVAAAATIALVALGGTALAVGAAGPAPAPVAASTASGTTPTSPTSTSSATPTSASAPAPAIDRERAVDIALQHVGGGRVTDVENETEHGRAVWDVEIVDGAVEQDVDVDAATGEVTRVQTDNDDRDDRDDD